MARAPKKPKFALFKQLDNCYDWFEHQLDYRARIEATDYVVAEFGCGKGSFLLNQARIRDGLFIGVDIKSDRMSQGAARAKQVGQDGIIFIRADLRHANEIFPFASIDEIWLSFPDPYPKKGDAKHRLSGPAFLRQYYQILKPNGKLYLKTDACQLFDWSLGQAKSSGFFSLDSSSRDLHSDDSVPPVAKQLTNYEARFVSSGKKIYFASFSRRQL